MCVGRRCFHQCRKTQRNLLCCPASLNHGGQQRLTDRIWSSVWDLQPRPRPQQSVRLWKREQGRGGSSHSTGPRWATESVITRCTVYVNVCWCMWVCLPFKSAFGFLVYTTFIIVNLMTYFPCITDADLATHNLIILSPHKLRNHVERCLERIILLTDSLGYLRALEQPWIFPQANLGASINIHRVCCDLQWERPSRYSSGGAHCSLGSQARACISAPWTV